MTTLGERIRPWLKLRPAHLKPTVPAVAEARTGLSMGEHCELMAKEWQIIIIKTNPLIKN